MGHLFGEENKLNGKPQSYWIKKAIAGDKYSCELLLLYYGPVILKHLNKRIDNRSDALDVFQDVNIKIFINIKNFKLKSSFYTWVYRITENTIKNYYREIENYKRLVFDNEGLRHCNLHNTECPESLLSRYELGKDILIKLNKLPTELQQSIFLREFNGLSYEEISKTMRCPVGTVRSRLHRARFFLDR